MTSSDSSLQSGDRSPRFLTWVAFLVFSTVTLGSTIEAVQNSSVRNSNGGHTSNQNWALACSSITFIITLGAVAVHLSAKYFVLFVGTKLEGFVCLLLIAFWASNVAVVTNPNNGLACEYNGAVSNGNLYYFSWAGLFCAVILATSFIRSVHHLDLPGEMRQRATRLTLWSAMTFVSLVAMGSSAHYLDGNCRSGYYVGVTYCRRSIFGIILGVISTVLSIYVAAMKIMTRRTFFVVEAAFSALLVVTWSFAVALLTAEAGPGHALGNLYYFTWASLIVSLLLCSSLYEEYRALKPSGAETASASNANRDIEVQHVHNLGDDI
mmetsp:Transcript_6168/g.9006  ORF Transcript_6168/g.9006 Transcript_6168/m.9006 type:complete len:323 (+) Transcript_6168:58-1026(+)